VLRRYFDDAALAALTPRLRPGEPTGLDYYPLLRPGERFPVADPHSRRAWSRARPTTPRSCRRGLGQGRVAASPLLADAAHQPVTPDPVTALRPEPRRPARVRAGRLQGRWQHLQWTRPPHSQLLTGGRATLQTAS